MPAFLSSSLDGGAGRGAEDRQAELSSGVTIVADSSMPHVVGARRRSSAPAHTAAAATPSAPATRTRGCAVAALDVLDQAVQGLVHVTVVDRDRVLVARDGRGRRARAPARRTRSARRLGVDRLLVGVDPGQLVGEQLRAGVVDDRLERIAPERTRRRTARGRSSGDRRTRRWARARSRRCCSGARSLSAKRGLQGGDAPADDDHPRASRV